MCGFQLPNVAPNPRPALYYAHSLRTGHEIAPPSLNTPDTGRFLPFLNRILLENGGNEVSVSRTRQLRTGENDGNAR
jgi:hypothetical protein